MHGSPRPHPQNRGYACQQVCGGQLGAQLGVAVQSRAPTPSQHLAADLSLLVPQLGQLFQDRGWEGTVGRPL